MDDINIYQSQCLVQGASYYITMDLLVHLVNPTLVMMCLSTVGVIVLIFHFNNDLISGTNGSSGRAR